MALTTLTAKTANVLLIQINLINQVNQVLPGKVHNYHGKNFKAISEASKPTNEDMEALYKSFDVKFGKDEKTGIKKRETLEPEAEEVKYKAAEADILAKELKVPILKLDFADVSQIGIPTAYDFKEYFSVMVNDAPKEKTEEVKPKMEKVQ